MDDIEDIQVDLETLDKWILKEAAGCRLDDEKCQVWSYTHSGCILFASALAKKILGIWGINIGNDPRRAAKLGYSHEARDFREERHQAEVIYKEDPQKLKSELERLDHEERFVTRLLGNQDDVKWRKMIELEEIIMRRAMALERARLVETNVDTLIPTEAAQRETELGGDGSIPAEGTIQITSVGMRCVGSQNWPTPKKNQRQGTERWDYDVEFERR